MFERFTDRARRVIVLAQEEARLLNHNYIGTEHLLLGLLHEGEGVAAQALAGAGVTAERARALVVEVVGPSTQTVEGNIPFTPRAKRALELSLREALSLGHNYIGTEHVLLGLIRQDGTAAAQILLERIGLDREGLRAQTLQLMSGPPRAAPAAAAAPAPAGPPEVAGPPEGADSATCPWCRADLEGRLGTRPLTATRDGEGGLDPLLVVYCRSCGRFLNLLPAPAPPPSPAPSPPAAGG